MAIYLKRNKIKNLIQKKKESHPSVTPAASQVRHGPMAPGSCTGQYMG